jgi:predicted CXXCH cytochrome family protein
VKRALLAAMLLFALGAVAQSGDVLGAHDLSTTASPVRGAMSAACLYCHAPHSSRNKGPLWSQTLSSQTYSQLYTSDTIQNATMQPQLGDDSSLCLSCHDGTVAPGQMVPYGPTTMSQPMTNGLIPHLEASHPFSLKLPLKDSANLVPSLNATGATADSTQMVKLMHGNVECGSCHNPHAQAVDKNSPNFLVRDNLKGGLCLSCHETNPRIVNAVNNPLSQWTTSAHAISVAVVNPGSGLGGYSTVADFACQSCHSMHNAGGASGLLHNPTPAVPNIDATSQSCVSCHNGNGALLQPVPNVFAEFTKKNGHPFAIGSNTHTQGEPVVLNQNRHATCADCHNSHVAGQVLAFSAAPNVRPSQNGVNGIAADGSSLTGPATKQYETCLRCHGNSSGKQILPEYGYLPTRAAFAGDPLNLIQQFGTTALSTHPVMRDATGISQPSLLPAMWDIFGKIQTRSMGTRIFCSDCHNSDDNREFGGVGPNGPHGSANDHILERPYLMSQVTPGAWPTAGPGTLVVNLNTDMRTDPGSGGPFSLCAKCHDLTSILSNTSFPGHSNHIKDGFSCSVCHSAHGVPAGGGLSGQGLINFDVNVVRPNNGVLAYANKTCTLTCHMQDHNGSSGVTPSTGAQTRLGRATKR